MARSLWQRVLTHDMWGVFVDTAPFDPSAADYGASATPLCIPSSSVFWADPFFVDEHTVLVEQLDYSVGYGRIFQVPIDDPKSASPVLDDGIHASFPFVITVDDDILVIPERADTHRMEIYRWDPAARTLDLAHVALEGTNVADPVIWHDQGSGMYFLFFLDNTLDFYSTLRLFQSDRIDRGWQEHPASPIAQTAAGARPAGAIRCDDGVLYRVGQDCVGSYGAAVITFRIETLDADDYAEHLVGRTVSAVPGFEHGFHTLNTSPSGELQVIDARRYQSSWTSPSVVGARVKRIGGRARSLLGDRSR